jgi:phage anti-repressor protein
MVDKARFKDFLKVHSTIPNTFIDTFIDTCGEGYSQTTTSLNIDIVAKWLNVQKFNLMSTLRDSYRDGIDYVVIHKPSKRGKQGSNNYKEVLLTPDCFKRLCMRSKSKKAEEVRTYYIQLESLLMKYYEHMMNGMETEITSLKHSLKPSKNKKDHAGYIYILKASQTKDSVYKLGRTKDLSQRLSTYQTGILEEVEVIFKFRSDSLKALEACIKKSLEEYKVRKYKELYAVDINIIKTIVNHCDAIQNVKQVYALRKPPKMTGGYYIALIKEV